MLSPTLRGTPVGVGIGLVLIFLGIGVVQKLLSLGGTPEQLGTSVHYRMRPMIKAIFFIGTIAGLAMIWSGIQDLHKGQIVSGVLQLVFGLAFVMFAPLALTQIILDESGIHFRSALCRETFIAWKDLNHFEQFTGTNSRTMLSQTTYYIRSNDGKTIAASDNSFDTADLMHRIQQHHHLPEKPYKRQHWYGG